MSVLDKKTAVDLVKLLIFIVVTTLATGVLVVTIGNISFARQHASTRPSSSTPPASSRATTSGSPASRSARSRTSRSSTAPAPW